MAKKNVVIIGTSTGIGKELAKVLEIGDDYRVIRASHHRDHGFAYVDLTNRNSISAFVHELKESDNEFRIDLLVLNSGIASSNSIMHSKDKEIIDSFQINTINQIILLREIAPLFRSGAKLLFINSKSALVTLPFLGIYAATKKANLAIAEALNFEFKILGVDVITAFIGNTKTNMWTEKFTNVDEIKSNNSTYASQVTNAMELAKKKYANAMEPKYVAEKLHKIITTNRPKYKYYIGSDTISFLILKQILPKSLFHHLIKKQYGFIN